MVLNTQRKQTKVVFEKKRNQNHQTKDAKDRDKSLKEEYLILLLRLSWELRAEVDMIR